jgi:hypothetical protein
VQSPPVGNSGCHCPAPPWNQLWRLGACPTAPRRIGEPRNRTPVAGLPLIIRPEKQASDTNRRRAPMCQTQRISH